MTEPLFLKILNLVFKEVQADRFLVVIHDDQRRLCSRLSFGVDWAIDQDISREMVKKTLEIRQPLFIRDLRTHPLFQAHPSVLERKIAGAICLPLLTGDRPGGAVYMDRTTARPPFTIRDLEFLIAAAVFFNHPSAADEGTGTSGNGNGDGALSLLVGQDGSLRRVRALVERVRNTAAPIFLSGESGTGKELVARIIHETGARKAGPFIAINCGAIPDQLLESELFGYVRGAFTGATRDKSGLIEDADQGTFFLDEIADLMFPLQAKLLRVVEEKRIRRLGENRTRNVDVRFISATNKDLEKAVREGKFREDLYYRLKIIPIELPPLRERREDLLLLINHFLEKYAREMKRARPYFSPGAVERLLQYPWPGNVRELQNEIHRCLVVAGDIPIIREDYLSERISPGKETGPEASWNFFQARIGFEKRFLREALARCRFHKARTAAEIGLTRQGLFKLLKKYKIQEKTGP